MPSQITTESIANSRRLCIVGNFDSKKYDLVRNLSDHYINNRKLNRKVMIFSYKSSINSVKNGRCLREIKSIDIQNRTHFNEYEYNFVYNITTLKKLDTLLSSLNLSDSIVVLDGFDDLMTDTKFTNKRGEFSNITTLFENDTITPILISESFPENKYKLIQIYNFDFVFFNKIPATGSLNSKCTQLRKEIFGEKPEFGESKFEEFIRWISRDDVDFIYAGYGHEWLQYQENVNTTTRRFTADDLRRAVRKRQLEETSTTDESPTKLSKGEILEEFSAQRISKFYNQN